MLELRGHSDGLPRQAARSLRRRANLLEEPGEPLPVRDGAIEVAYTPFEVITIALD
jgi:hypothetical protein